MSDKTMKQINKKITSNMENLSKIMGNLVYSKKPIAQRVQIFDTKKSFNVVFYGIDMDVHVMSWWDDTDHDNIAATVKFKMAQDTRTLDVQVFNKDHVDDFIEAIQDAAIAASSATPVIHDDEGFQLLRPKKVFVVSESGHPYKSRMPAMMRRIRRNGRSGEFEGIIPDNGWAVNIEKRNVHYELLDAVSMVFSVVGTNTAVSEYWGFRYGRYQKDTYYYAVGEMLEILKAVGGYADPTWADIVINMLRDCTITVEQCKADREMEEQRKKTGGDVPVYLPDDVYEPYD